MKIKFLLDQPQTQHIQIIGQTIDIDIYTFINRLAVGEFHNSTFGSASHCSADMSYRRYFVVAIDYKFFKRRQCCPYLVYFFFYRLYLCGVKLYLFPL